VPPLAEIVCPSMLALEEMTPLRSLAIQVSLSGAPTS
jgi:hypothetical protein